MKPFFIDPCNSDVSDTDALRRRYQSRVASRTGIFFSAFFSTIPLWPGLVVTLVGVFLPNLEMVAAGGMLALLAVPLLCIIWYRVGRRLRHLFRLRHLARHGRFLEGRLIACKRRAIETDSDGPDTVAWTVDYEVESPSGKVLQRTAMRHQEVPSPLPVAGTPVVVLMVDENLFDLV